MKMNALLGAAALALAPGAYASAAETPAQAATAFYAVHATFHPSDGIPDAAARKRYEPTISPALDKLLAEGDAAEARYARANEDSPPLVEGDLFTSNFEGSTSFRIGACTRNAARAACKVDLVYADPDPHNRKDRPFYWTDTVYLVVTPAGWRVDDIGYGGTWDFGNKGRLTATLKQAIHDAGP